MKFRPIEQFVEDYQRLPKRLQRRADQALAFLLQNLRYPSLRAKKMEGQRDPHGRDIWEARVTRGYRFTFAIEDDTYILYRIGPNDIEQRLLGAAAGSQEGEQQTPPTPVDTSAPWRLSLITVTKTTSRQN